MEKIRDKELFELMDKEKEKMVGWFRDVKHVKENELTIYVKGWDDGFQTLQARLRDMGYVDPRTDETIEKEKVIK